MLKRVIYICSAGHSGSTLISLLLGAHSNITAIGEISHFPKNLALNSICTCGKPVNECFLWSRVVKNLSNTLNVDLTLNPYALNLGIFKARALVDKKKQTRFSIIRDRFLLGSRYLELKYNVPFLRFVTGKIVRGLFNSSFLFEEVSKIMSTEVVVDSSKSYLRAVGLYLLQPEVTRVILFVRDGRGVYCSGISHGYSAKKSISNWKNVYHRAPPLLKKYLDTNHLLIVKYEDLVQNTEVVLKQICNFADLEYEPSMRSMANRPYHIANGNNMRFSRNPKLKLDLRWKRDLSLDQLRYFDLRAGDLNRSLGYN